MSEYNLSHLTQDITQDVWGPIQDDEALFLYGLIRIVRIKRILEIGGLNGYSALNFLKALDHSQDSIMYTCDLNPVPKLSDNHKILIKDGKDLSREDLDNKKIDMIFFDCHDLIQMEIYNNLLKNELIDENEIYICLHDTNLHYEPYARQGPYIESEGGFAHQTVERIMVNLFKNLGYDILHCSTKREQHHDEFPFRHGLTICKKFHTLST